MILTDRAYESEAWDNTILGSAHVAGKQQKKISTSSLRANLLLDSVNDMDTEELDPIEYSLREESGLTQTKVSYPQTILPDLSLLLVTGLQCLSR